MVYLIAECNRKFYSPYRVKNYMVYLVWLPMPHLESIQVWLKVLQLSLWNRFHLFFEAYNLLLSSKNLR